MLKLDIIVGSTRPGRKAQAVAQWVHGIATRRSDAEFELVDIKDYNLPLLDEASPPSLGKYSQPHTKVWAEKIASFAGGVRAVESLRLVMGELKVADVREQVMLSLATDFENFTVFKPDPKHEKAVNTMLDQVIAWGGALKTLRAR